MISGDTAGVVDVFRLKNMEQDPMTAEEQRMRLEKAIYPNGIGNDAMSDQEDEDEEAADQQQENDD